MRGLHGISLDVISVVSIFTESILYGIFTVLFSASMVILFRKHKRSRTLNVPVLSVSISMFMIATIHVGVDLRRLLDALFHSQDVPGGTIGLLSQINSVEYLLRTTAYAIQTIIGDGFLLYRLAIVWNHDKRILVPLSIPFVGTIVCGVGSLVSFARVSLQEMIIAEQLQKWNISFFALTLFTNLTYTFFLAFKIWLTHRRAAASQVSSSLWPAFVIVVESGVVYSATLVVVITLWLNANYAQFIVLDAVTQIIGVVFSLIIVRVGMGLTSEVVSTTRGEKISFRRDCNSQMDSSHSEAGVAMKPIDENTTHRA
ncbi:hypothetical protein HWV62_25940 [Athelia sp. TMB]|nr:hypothetical protein HWV62_25940 [Athelia sp. TMB]